jgi:aryl-alcohol dehydrogenase-like predicted oxidoreductase
MEVSMVSDGIGIDRRKFLKLGAATSSLAIGGCGRADEVNAEVSDLEMQYRPLGGTGLKVSAVSFGTYGFDNPDLLSAALDAGMTTICTSSSYQNGRAEEAVGNAIRTIGDRRDELVLFTGAVVKSGAKKQSVLDSIDASLRRLQTDRVEIFRITGVSSPDDLRVDALYEAFEEARAAGKVSHLGLSGHHGGMQEVLNAAIDDGRFEVLFTKYDFASYPDQEEILGRASSKGIGTLVFKTGAGNREQEIKDLEAGGLSYRQATVKWALTNSNVASVCVGITNFSQIREYAKAAGSKITEPEIAMLRDYAGQMYDKYCRFCSTCEASCPHEVAVADVMRYAMYFKYYGREKDSMELYGALPKGCSAAVCNGCSAPCESACPFGRKVKDELVEAHRLLSFARA